MWGGVVGGDISTVSVGFMKECAGEVMRASPIRYVREAKLCGRLFEPEGAEAGEAGEVVSSVDTGFWVDHAEPLRVLARVKDVVEWPLGGLRGGLRDGQELLLIVEARRPCT